MKPQLPRLMDRGRQGWGWRCAEVVVDVAHLRLAGLVRKGHVAHVGLTKMPSVAGLAVQPAGLGVLLALMLCCLPRRTVSMTAVQANLVGLLVVAEDVGRVGNEDIGGSGGKVAARHWQRQVQA